MQALEALENLYLTLPESVLAKSLKHRITALREALAQPEQEPTPWRDMIVVSLVREGINKHRARELADHFAAQPEPTCPECKAAVLYECVACSSNNYPPTAQPKQEPCIGKDPRCPCQDGDACHYKDCGDTKARPAAQRTWVGLTEEDWDHIDNTNGTSQDTFIQGAAWAAARLKAKNDH
jgi:hypothetical protein